MSLATASRDWDAATYDRVSGPQVEMGREVLDRLALRGHEAVLDAGCGSGRLTRELVERLPSGRVVAVDSSRGMVEMARAALGGRAEVMRADLAELELPEPVDAVFSNAVFHWVPDHRALFARLHDALRPGGRLAAQCGGRGNIEGLHRRAAEVGGREPFAAYMRGWSDPWRFESAAGPRRCSRRPASPMSSAGSSGARSDQRSPSSTCARSRSALTSGRCRTSCAGPS